MVVFKKPIGYDYLCIFVLHLLDCHPYRIPTRIHVIILKVEEDYHQIITLTILF